MALFPEEFKDRLLFAIPKKGRLYEKSIELLAGADIQYTRSNRLDVCLVRNFNMALVFLPAADIPRFVGEGNVDLGITGQDMCAEADMGELITEVLQLGFGKCKLQVQVPERSEYKTAADLVGKKVATSFDFLAGKYFDKLDGETEEKSGAEKGKGKKTTVEYIGGSVEAACALGLADGIVDLVESGETMRAAGLHAIDTLLTSQAVLIRAKRPSPSHADLMQRVTSRIAGVLAAQKYVLCNYNIERSKLHDATKITPGRRAATVSPLDDGEWVAVSSMVERASVAQVMDELQAVGAHDVLIIGIANCRV